MREWAIPRRRAARVAMLRGSLFARPPHSIRRLLRTTSQRLSEKVIHYLVITYISVVLNKKIDIVSWDLFVQDWGDAHSLNEIPIDFKPETIGKRSELISKIKKIEPAIIFSNQSIGKIRNKHFCIEINLGETEELKSFMISVHGNELAIPCVANILIKLNLKASDGSSPHFFDAERAILDLNKWIDFRQKILSNLG